MTTPATWAIGADMHLLDCQDLIRLAFEERTTHAGAPSVFEDALRAIVSESLSRLDRHADWSVIVAAQALARAGDDESIALVKKWVELC